MEYVFEQETLSWLETVQMQEQNLELSQEFRLNEGQGDVQRIIGTWAQPVIRSKEWYSDSVSVSGGIMAWALYSGNDGQLHTVDGWIPFQTRFVLPVDKRDGQIRVLSSIRYTDGRSTSPGKLQLRCGVGLWMQAMCMQEGSVFKPAAMPEGTQVLTKKYPLRLTMEAGEKEVSVQDSISLSTDDDLQIVYTSVNPQITEKRVLGDQLAMRGCANVHLLMVNSRGELSVQDIPAHFSQIAELSDTYGNDAHADILCCVSAVETQMQEGAVTVQTGIRIQYRIEDITVAEIAEDAYCPGMSLQNTVDMLKVPSILEVGKETVNADEVCTASASQVVDTNLRAEHPRMRRTDQGIVIMDSVGAQILYRDSEGNLQGTAAKWDTEIPLMCSEQTLQELYPAQCTIGHAQPGMDGIRVQYELQIERMTLAEEGIPMITAMAADEQMQMPGDGPSLIMRRASDASLWSIAKDCSSTVEAIRNLNGLDTNPQPGQLLLIPVLP